MGDGDVETVCHILISIIAATNFPIRNLLILIIFGLFVYFRANEVSYVSSGERRLKPCIHFHFGKENERLHQLHVSMYCSLRQIFFLLFFRWS